jgi:hypothetical protein
VSLRQRNERLPSGCRGKHLRASPASLAGRRSPLSANFFSFHRAADFFRRRIRAFALWGAVDSFSYLELFNRPTARRRNRFPFRAFFVAAYFVSNSFIESMRQTLMIKTPPH